MKYNLNHKELWSLCNWELWAMKRNHFIGVKKLQWKKEMAKNDFLFYQESVVLSTWPTARSFQYWVGVHGQGRECMNRIGIGQCQDMAGERQHALLNRPLWKKGRFHLLSSYFWWINPRRGEGDTANPPDIMWFFQKVLKLFQMVQFIQKGKENVSPIIDPLPYLAHSCQDWWVAQRPTFLYTFFRQIRVL